ncbi:MRC [Mytilus coruscus]|uniref:MRC n=1 Tax=Mytilus coruscus TaxID=42192 RepID=A0A6J8CNW0_MYTCO|nr:MRC [Mytilus coruscus]
MGEFLKFKFRASFKREHFERFELTGAINTVIVSTKIGCFETCFLDNSCLSLFYNDNTKQCVLHSKDFMFKSPQRSGTGWTHYVIDGLGQCPLGALLYRPLDFCYTVKTIHVMIYADIKQGCTNQGASLAVVDSPQKQFYFERIFVGRPHERVCIAGEKQNDLITWELDDGTPLQYFNWAITDPDGGVLQRCLVLTADDTWFDTECNRNDPWTGRCPFGALLYRTLDFCYIVNQSNVTVFKDIKQDCKNKGGSLAVVDSQQKQSYFEHFLAGRPHFRVPIAGESQNAKDWKLDDGTPLQYFNWSPKEPDDNNQQCLELYIQDKWYDIECKRKHPSVYVCEINVI